MSILCPKVDAVFPLSPPRKLFIVPCPTSISQAHVGPLLPPLAPPPPKFNCAHGNDIDRASKFKKACSCYDHFDSKTTNNTIFFFEMMSEKLEQPLKATHSMDYKSKSRHMSLFFPSFNQTGEIPPLHTATRIKGESRTGI